MKRSEAFPLRNLTVQPLRFRGHLSSMSHVHGTEALLNTVNAQLAKPYTAKMHALWMLLTTGEGQWAQGYEQHEQIYRSLLASTEWRQAATAGSTDAQQPLLASRQWMVLRNEMLEHQGDEELRAEMIRRWNELNVHISMYRTQIEGRSLTEKETLILFRVLDDDQKRKRLWKAYMQLGIQIAHPLLELVRMRNRLARAQGFPDYYAMKLAAQELDEEQLDSIIHPLIEQLGPSYRKVKKKIDADISRRFGIPAGAIRSWHYSHPFFQSYEALESVEAVDLSRFADELTSWFSQQGLGLDDVIQRMDLGEGTGKSSASFCLPVDRNSDIRISCHVNHDFRGAAILLHEMGHAFVEQSYDAALPFLLRQPAHPFLSEAAALFMERLLYVPGWTPSLMTSPSAYVRAKDRQPALRSALLVKLFWTITLVQFERELYRNPEQNLNSLWWELVEEYQGIHRPDEWDAPYWASKQHLSTLPATYYYYLLGEVAASQLQQSLDEQFGEWHSKRSLQHLRKTLFQPGMSRPWRDVLHDCVHGPLQAHAIIHELQ